MNRKAVCKCCGAALQIKAMGKYDKKTGEELYILVCPRILEIEKGMTARQRYLAQKIINKLKELHTISELKTLEEIYDQTN